MTALTEESETRFVPGSNLKGTVGGANWCFLLPSLELGRIVCLGLPSTPALATLARLGDEVIVCAPAGELRGIRRRVGLDALRTVTLLEVNRRDRVPLPDASVDLVVAARLPRWGAERRSRLQQEARRLLKPDGLAYLELRSRADGRVSGSAGRAGGAAGEGGTFWLAPASGEVRAAAPLDDLRAIGFLERRFQRRLHLRRLLRRPGRELARYSAVSRVVQRRGTLFGRPGEKLPSGPPRYLRDLAAAAGVHIDESRWALAAPGEYPSQKVLVFLFAADGDAPQFVVKITRDASLNPRLENEWRALTMLRDGGIGADDTLPRPRFFGLHAGLAVLGESAIDGERFRERTHATADCPYARAAVDWLLDLGTATVSRAREDARGALSELEARFQRFKEIYRLEADEENFLAARVSALARSNNGFPLVFQHGDPGPWNLLITTDGKPAFVDWEAAEPHGIPLWDLFHFMRSYGLRVSRATGTREPLQSFAEQYLEETALARLLDEATERFCARTGLSQRLIEPLFYTCWMHRALKEAATLPPDRLDSGRYVNILRLAIARRNSPGLRRLFSSAGV
jgi:aminoglycoside phosphotransferase (APT) family kinase protein/SAM-dependent methyltransferase